MKTNITCFFVVAVMLASAYSCTSKKVAYTVLNPITINQMTADSFDLEYYEQNKHLATGAIKEGENGEKRRLVESTNMYVEYYTPPLPKFYTIYKEYYKNGKLKKKGYEVNASLKIGIWEFYDEQGNKTTQDMDKYLDAFDYNKVLLFLDKQGDINLKTGEGRDSINMWYDAENKIWYVQLDAYGDKRAHAYSLSGKNGKVLTKGEIISVD